MERDANGNSIVRRTAYRNASTKIREIIKAIRETADLQARSKPECAVRRAKGAAANGANKNPAVFRRKNSNKASSGTNKRERTEVKNSAEDVREVKRLKCLVKDQEDENELIDIDEAKENIMAPNLIPDSTSSNVAESPMGISVDCNGNDTPMKGSPEASDDLDLQIAVMADCDGDRPIHLAVLNGDVQIAERLLTIMKKVGVPIDIRNYLKQTPLHLACIYGDVGMVSLLLAEGSASDLTDRSGNTCIHLAVKYKNIQCLLFLLNKLKTEQHVIDAVNYDGFTALHLAVQNKNENFVKLISAVGADINIQDRKMGRTCLHWSVVQGNLSMTRLLVNLDADLSVTDYTGSVPVTVAQERGLCRITNYLENNMNNSIKQFT